MNIANQEKVITQ